MKQDAAFPPDAYIIGAPKCGTTALAFYLSRHALIRFSDPKEPHYFAEDLPKYKVPTSEAEYRAYFPPPRAPGSILMEGSVYYLLSQTAVAAIQRVRPDAKFIVMLRDPVAMAPSLHQQLVAACDEDEPNFETAWRLSPLRRRGERLPKLCRAAQVIDYQRSCALGEQVGRFFAQVPPERRLVLVIDEMRADAGGVYRRALDFLGLPDDGRADFPRVNEADLPRWRMLQPLVQREWPVLKAIAAPIKRVLGVKSLGVTRTIRDANMVKTGSPRLTPELRAELADYFAEDVAKLSALLGRDLASEFGWASPPSRAVA